MFGYIIANQKLLSEEQKARYKGCYCGLCAALKRRHGFFGRVALTYDMTFLVLLLSAMYEPEEEKRMEICVLHPIRKHFCWESSFTDYAADMNVALAYHNCRDDFEDDGSVVGFWESEFLTEQYAEVCKAWPRQCAAIEQCLRDLGEIERSGAQTPDAAAACFGRLMGELFCVDREYDRLLRPFGDALGRFIYLMDAVLDLKDDLQKGSYNPLKDLCAAGYGTADFHAILTAQLGAAADAFERLPLLQDLELLRNILYSGVWQRYGAARTKENRRNPDEGSL